MNDLNTLNDAFAALERRADALPSDAYEFTVPSRSPASRLVAPAVAVAAVVATAGAVAIWSAGSDGSHPAAGGSPSAPPSSIAPPSSSAPPSSPQTSATPGSGYQPPTTADALAAKTRSILAGIATITVIPMDSGPSAPQSSGSDLPRVLLPTPTTSSGPSAPGAPTANSLPVVTDTSGSFIKGIMTAGGRSGGYDLNVYATDPGSAAFCDSDEGNVCSVQRLPNGDSLAFGTWHDQNVPGGITYEVQVVRRDGADILLHLSTEDDPKGMGRVTADRAPLTKQQMIDFVTSTDW